ncbi:MAG: hypothetical protein H7331_09025, partial [Bacteroidia bacterium]|nr:hypothetical protein [Bacteroidia bacterium]
MNERLFVLNINERNNFELFGVSPIPFLGFAINDNLLGLIDNKYKLHEYPLNKKLLNHTQTKFTYLPSKRNRRDKVVMKYRNGTNDLDFIMEWHAITHHPFGTNKNDINLSGSFPMLDINVSKTNEVLYYCDGWKEFEAGNINQAQAIYYNFKLNKYCAKKIFKSDEANVLQIANTIEKFLITDAEDFLIYNTFNTNALGVYDIRQKSNVLIYLDTIINSYTLTKNDSFAVVSNANQLFLSSLKTHELN